MPAWSGAENWRWSSLYHRLHDLDPKNRLSEWPVKMPRNWVDRVNKAQTEAAVEALRRSVNRGSPFGAEDWQEETAKDLGLGFTLRPRGRPRKDADA